MSPRLEYTDYGDYGFPRVSGDEPSPESVTATLIRFSPRERG